MKTRPLERSSAQHLNRKCPKNVSGITSYSVSLFSCLMSDDQSARCARLSRFPPIFINFINSYKERRRMIELD